MRMRIKRRNGKSRLETRARYDSNRSCDTHLLLRLMCEPVSIIPLERFPLSPLELEDPAAGLLEKVAVVCDGDDGPLEVGEERLQKKQVGDT